MSKRKKGNSSKIAPKVVFIAYGTRSSAQGNCSAKSLAALVMSSILHCSSILPCPPCLPPVMLSEGELRLRQGGPTGGGGSHRGEGGRGHFSPAAIYGTTTWCFTLKGLQTIRILTII